MKHSNTAFTLLATLGLTIALSACGEKAEETNTPEAAAAQVAEKVESAVSKSSSGEIGIAECDKYISAYKACLTKMPDEVRPAMEQSFKTTVAAWKSVDTSATGELASACTTMYDSAKTSMTSMGCDW